MTSQNRRSARATLARKLRKAANLGWSEWRELAIATNALLFARIVFARLPARSLLARLQAHQTAKLDDDHNLEAETYTQDGDADARLLRLEWAIAAAAMILPWRTDCLIRCLAADKILRRRGLTPEFYLGVTTHLDSEFGAHAWVKCRGISVAGGQGREFEVLIGPD